VGTGALRERLVTGPGLVVAGGRCPAAGRVGWWGLQPARGLLPNFVASRRRASRPNHLRPPSCSMHSTSLVTLGYLHSPCTPAPHACPPQAAIRSPPVCQDTSTPLALHRVRWMPSGSKPLTVRACSSGRSRASGGGKQGTEECKGASCPVVGRAVH